MNSGIIVIIVMLTVLIGLIGCLLIAFFRQKQKPSNTNEQVWQIQNLKEQIATQKQELTNLIVTFKESWHGSDKKQNEEITKLLNNLLHFEKNLDCKNTENKIETTNLNNQVNSIINELKLLKQSTTTLNDVDKNIKTLNDIFLNTKRRGNLGEYFLDRILGNMLGTNQRIWERQYQTNDGKIIDAYIRTADQKEGIAIDSKFSLENYQKYLAADEQKIKTMHLKAFQTDIKNRIREVAKYIKPENHISSAIMFIPSEETFGFIFANFSEEIIDFAFKEKVWITSPTTLAATLFIIDAHLKESEFNHNIEVIRKKLIKMREEFNRWIERWDNVNRQFNKTYKSIENLDITHKKLSKSYSDILNSEDKVTEKPLLVDASLTSTDQTLELIV